MRATSADQPTGSAVFRDLGFFPEEAAYLKVRSELMVGLQTLISVRGLKPTATAKLLGVPQSQMRDLLHGRIDLFSADTLIGMLTRLGVRAKVVLQPSRGRVEQRHADSLKRLLQKVSRRNLHGEVSTAPAVGREAW